MPAITFALTREFIQKWTRGRVTKPQLELLGQAWPPVKGWIDLVVGTFITQENANAFMDIGRQRHDIH